LIAEAFERLEQHPERYRGTMLKGLMLIPVCAAAGELFSFAKA
jgi:hypothetical protein